MSDTFIEQKKQDCEHLASTGMGAGGDVDLEAAEVSIADFAGENEKQIGRRFERYGMGWLFDVGGK